jgi:predicted nucleic acid-binding Zn ribbon protein
VDRLISPPAIRFKGTGWYVTDYADKKQPPESEKGEPTADTKKSESKKTDSKGTDSKKNEKAS